MKIGIKFYKTRVPYIFVPTKNKTPLNIACQWMNINFVENINKIGDIINDSWRGQFIYMGDAEIPFVFKRGKKLCNDTVRITKMFLLKSGYVDYKVHYFPV